MPATRKRRPQKLSEGRSPAETSPLAKLSHPRLHAAFPRTRLFERLDDLRDRPVVWIAGPPGAGKTTLAATWLQARKLPGIWYQLDTGDSDPATFFFYLRQAVETRAARTGKVPLPLLTPEYVADLPGFARRWFRELFVRLPPASVLALDNYHEVGADSALHRMLAAACAEIPERAQVLIMSWVDPPPEFSSLVAGERLAWIDADELKLRPEEAEGIASGRAELSADQIRELNEECDGWAAGFTLMRERARRTGLVSRLDQRGSMKEVFDYFMAQAFGDASAEERETLIKTAFLPSFTEAMACELSGSGKAGDLLERLHRRHLFIDRRYGEEATYEYHMLFRAFLLDQAKRYYTPFGITELSQRAASLLERAGLREGAVQLLLDGRDPEGAAVLIEKLAPGVVAAGRGAALREWLLQLPAEVRERRPWLAYWLGVGTTGLNLQAARAAFEEAYAGFVQSSDRTGQAMAVVGVLQTHFLELDDLKRIQPWLPILESLFAEEPVFPSADVAARAYATLVGLMLWAVPSHPLFPQCVERLEALVSQPLSPDVKLIAGGQLAEYYGMAGFIEKAERIAVAIEPVTAEVSTSPFARASWWLRSCPRDYVLGDYLTLGKKLEHALAIAVDNGFHYMLQLIYAFQAEAALDLGDLEELPTIIEKWREALPRAGRLSLGRYHWIQAKLSALKGDLGDALRECESACSIAAEVGSTYSKHACDLTLASIQLERGEFDAALATLSRFKGVYSGEYFPYQALRNEVFEAVLAAASSGPGQRQRWRSQMESALRAIQKLGVTVPAYRQPLLARQICELALSEDIEPGFVRAWIQKVNFRPRSPDVPGWPWPVRILGLGGLRIELDGVPLKFSGKVPRKPLELLQALLAFGGKHVTSETLCNALWGDSEADDAEAALRVTLSRLRKLLGRDAVALHEGKLSLDDHLCWVDTWSLERLCSRIEKEPRPEHGELLLQLYRGPFLEHEREHSWMLPLRQKIRQRFTAAASSLGRALEREQKPEQAIALYHRALEVDAGAEAIYRQLIAAHLALGQNAEALAAYRRCRESLAGLLGMQPGAATEALIRNIRSA